MIFQLLASGLLAAAQGVDARDKPFIAFVVMTAPVMIVFLVFAPKILRELMATTIQRIGVGTSRQDAGRISRQGAKKDLTQRRKDAKVEAGEERWA